MMHLLEKLSNIGAKRDDTLEIALQKRFLVYLGSAMSLGGLLWGSLCILYRMHTAAIIPFGYTVGTILNFTGFYFFRNFGVTRFIQVLMSLLLPFLFQFALGSFSSTGAVMLWALIALVGAFTFEELRHTLYWIFLYVALTVALGLVDGRRPDSLVAPEEIKRLFFVVNIAVISMIVSGLSYYFLKNRGKILEELAAAKKETDTLLATVDEGLFVISLRDGTYEVGAEQSAAIQTVFGVEKLPATSLELALEPYLDTKKRRQLKGFLTLLKSASVKKEMIRDLNPLDLVSVAAGMGSEKYLQFSFWPVTPGMPDRYLVRVKDATKATQLQQKLAENEKKSEESTNLILSVLHIGPKLLEDFLAGVRSELRVISAILQQDKSVAEVIREMEPLYRAVHSIKGNASLLDLKMLASAAHGFEEDLERMRDRSDLAWSDFIPLALHLSRLQNLLESLEDLLARLQNFRHETGGQTESAVAAIPNSVRAMAERLAAERGKKIALDASGFDTADIPNRFAYILRDISIQLARNSIAHGIELPALREAAGKDPVGLLRLRLEREPGAFTVHFKDDGKSFDFDAIRTLAREKYGDLEAKNDELNEKKLIKFLFEPGFSTQKVADMAAGRGMGLDIVRQRIKKMGGQMKIGFAPGKYTEFTMRFPLGETAEH